jgi:hypothetical protein
LQKLPHLFSLTLSLYLVLPQILALSYFLLMILMIEWSNLSKINKFSIRHYNY